VQARWRSDSFEGKVLRKVWRIEEKWFSQNLEERAAANSRDRFARSVRPDRRVELCRRREGSVNIVSSISK
jgi:hypothetical protein